MIEGVATVLAPTETIERPSATLPEVPLSAGGGLQRLVGRVRPLGAIKTAVVHPCDVLSLPGAFEARAAGLIGPVLVAPRARLEAAAAQAGLDLSGMGIEEVPHSHAAARAAELASEGRVAALMKGSLHTDELIRAILKSAPGLRTRRRLSHCFLMRTPACPRLFIITDAVINIAPTLEDKADIVRNAIDLAHAIGVAAPRVAILAAVETVNPVMPATLDAAALCKMAERGQITGALLDGPLAFDNAVSIAAARVKGITSPVAGHADVLVVPDLESGNMLAKQLEFMGDACRAGIVLGAKVPIVLTSRTDSRETRLASAAPAQGFIPLAPLHQPFALEAIGSLLESSPEVPQMACFDTAFHHTLPTVEQMLPLAYAAWERGLRRFGFHGLSYEYMSVVRPERHGELARGRVIVAHLGSGASCCAMQALPSQATTMSVSALDGLMMGTRTGTLAPGAVLYLMEVEKYTLEQVGHVPYDESGLLGLSGLSSEPPVLLADEARSDDTGERARAALALYVRPSVRETGALVALLGGLELLVFTAGAGEHCADIRKRICHGLGFLYIALDDGANLAHAPLIAAPASGVCAGVKPTNEEWVAARQAVALLRGPAFDRMSRLPRDATGGTSLVPLGGGAA